LSAGDASTGKHQVSLISTRTQNHPRQQADTALKTEVVRKVQGIRVVEGNQLDACELLAIVAPGQQND